MPVQRCRWCGQFVAYGTAPTIRTVEGYRPGHEVPGWATVEQMLCPQHSKDWSVDTPWNKPADLSLPIEVLPDKETR